MICMYCKLVNRLYDDDKIECKEGDMLLVQTDKIPDMTVATIQKIQVNVVTLLFDDPTIGYRPINIRVNEFIVCKKYRTT